MKDEKSLVLIDTSAWIIALRARKSQRAIKEVDAILAEGRAATSGVTMLELLSGARTEEEYTELLEDLSALHYLPTSKEIWSKSARMAFDLKRKGITIPTVDLVIASLAIDADCFLLHADVHFDLISKQTNLKTQNLTA